MPTRCCHPVRSHGGDVILLPAGLLLVNPLCAVQATGTAP